MSYRMRTVIIMFAYLFLNSIMFGAIFSRPYNRYHIMIGLAAGAVSQILFLYMLHLIQKTEK